MNKEIISKQNCHGCGLGKEEKEGEEKEDCGLKL